MAEGELAAQAAAREDDEFVSLDAFLTKRRVKRAGGVLEAKRSLISYTPTMFIGLGGTGAKTVDALKGQFLQRKLTDPIFAFLVFDIAEEEKDELSHIDPTSEFHCMELDDSHTYISSHRQLVREWWDEDYRPPRKLTDGGARAVRANGRLCFFHHALNNVYAQVASAAATIKAKVAGTRISSSEPIVYIIASLCGGTGSGTFLDMAFLVRHAFSQLGEPNVQIVAVFVLNDVYEKLLVPVDWMVLKRNTYAALKELEHFQLGGSCPEIERGRTIDYAEHGQLTVPYCKPYNLVYLMRSTTEAGVNVTNTRQMAYMLADGIFLQVATPLGTGQRGAFVFRAAGLLGSMHNARLCCYSSMGVGTLVYPRKRILNYGIWTLLAEQCRLLTGNNLGDARTDALAATFIDREGIASSDLHGALSTTRQGMPYEYKAVSDLHRALNRVGSAKYADAIEDFEKQVATRLGQLKVEMATKAKELKTAVAGHARARAHKLFTRGAGLGAARDYLAAITRADNDDEAAIDSQLAQAADQLASAKARAQSHVARIRKLRGWWDRFTNLDGCVEEYERAISDRVRLEIDVAILTVCKSFYRSLDTALRGLRDQLTSRLLEPIAQLGATAGERRKRSAAALAKLDRIHPHYTDRTHIRLLIPFAELRAQIAATLGLSPKEAAAGLAGAIPSICDYEAPAARPGAAASPEAVVQLLQAQAKQRCEQARIVSPGGAVAALQDFATDDEGHMDLEAVQGVIRDFYHTVQPQWIYNDAAFDRSAQLGAIGVGRDNGKLIGPGYSPKPMPATTGDLSAIPILRTEHGVPLCVLIGIQEMRNVYDAGLEERARYARTAQRRAPLHLFGPGTVDWGEPAECGSLDDQAVRLFALGLAFSHIFPPTDDEKPHLAEPWCRNCLFARGNKYFIQPYYTRADVGAGRVQAPKALGQGRYAAFEAFCKDRQHQDDIAQYEADRLVRVDPAEWHRKLLDYVEHELKPRLKSAKASKLKKLADILQRELSQLQDCLEKLREEL